MIITICGTPGSGKNTVSDIIAKKLDYKRYSVGGFRREKARELGMTLEEYNKFGETNSSTDKDADDWQKKIGETEDNFVIDGRTSFYFIPHSIKIFLDVSPEVGAERIMGDKRGAEETIKDKKAGIAIWKTRANSDIKRYKKYYNLNYYDKKHYDLFLDTSNLTIKQVTEKVMDFIKSRMKKGKD